MLNNTSKFCSALFAISLIGSNSYANAANLAPITSLLLLEDTEPRLVDSCQAQFVMDTNLGEGDGQIFDDVSPGFTQLGDIVYFHPRGQGGLWVTDGSSTGTYQVSEISPSSSSSFGRPVMVPLGNEIFFGASSSEGVGLWRSGGTAESTSLVRQLARGGGELPVALTKFNDRLYFISAGETVGDNRNDEGLWVSDGSTSGTDLLRDITPNSGSIASSEAMAITNNRLIFSARGDAGLEPWVSDGSFDGTQILRDIAEVSGSNADGYTPIGDKVFFFADNGINGYEAWVTDGTNDGTSLVKDIYPGGESGVLANRFNSQSLDVVDFVDLDGSALFIANDGTHGNELWISDGSSEGTIMLSDINPGDGDGLEEDALKNVAILNGKAYFPANESSITAEELWVTDGTVEGTQLFALQGASSSINPRYTVGARDLLFSNANGELLVIDESGNTNQIDLRPTTPLASAPSFFFDFNGQILFFAETGSINSDSGPLGRELWSLSCDFDAFNTQE